jgi:hypothetical protein
MDERSLSALQAYRPTLHRQWEARLRAAPVTSPLANPDALVYLMEWTLDQLFRELAAPHARRQTPRPPCPCGLNPLIAYFATARLSLHEALKVCAGAEPLNARDIEEMEQALETVARREIANFCALCLHNDRRDRHESPAVRNGAHTPAGDKRPASKPAGGEKTHAALP